MEKEFIPYEQALELTALGFNEECLAVVNVNSYELKIINGSYNEELYLPIPLYQQAFRWFREKYGLDSYINYDKVIKFYTYFICEEGVEELYPTYEEAELACLKNLIQIAKNK